MNVLLTFLVLCLALLSGTAVVSAAPFGHIDTLPLSERWFGIYLNEERVGFYRQNIEKLADGYRIEGNGSIRVKVMNYSREASLRETYVVSQGLALKAFDIEQTVNGVSSHVSGRANGSALQITHELNGKASDKSLSYKGDIYPGPLLNYYPLFRSVNRGAVYKVQLFDPEELKIKDIQITVLGEDKTSTGKRALKLRNTLYPFVTNDIWIDGGGDTVEESVRDGLVITRAERPEALGHFISNWALAKKDLIYDFSLVPITPPLKEVQKLAGLAIEIHNWNDALPLFQGAGQQAVKVGDGRVLFKTGTLAAATAISTGEQPSDTFVRPSAKIEADAPEIVTTARRLTDKFPRTEEKAKVLAAWTADWLYDTVADGGSAVESFKLKSGNCQTHARLYTALARAIGIPTRFVSGLVYLEGKGFLYHSWAESFLGNSWVSVDPTYNQLPANVTHLKFLEGSLPEDMAPVIAIIGRIKMTVLTTAYR